MNPVYFGNQTFQFGTPGLDQQVKPGSVISVRNDNVSGPASFYRVDGITPDGHVFGTQTHSISDPYARSFQVIA